MLLARSWSRFAGSVLVGRPIGDMLDNIFDSRSRRRPSSGGKADRYGTVFELFGAQKREGRRKTPGRENRSGFAWAQTVP